jgi:hypothetical protein
MGVGAVKPACCKRVVRKDDRDSSPNESMKLLILYLGMTGTENLKALKPRERLIR